MKRFSKILALAAAIVLGTLGAFGCGKDLPQAIKPTDGESNINLIGTSYVKNASLTAEELHIDNDFSGWVRYRYTGNSETLQDNIEKLVQTLNEKRYTPKQLERGYRNYFLREGDVDAEGKKVTIRFVNLNWSYDSYYKMQTVEEYLSSSGTAQMNYEFHDFEHTEKYNLVNATDKDKKKLKIWTLQGLTDGLVVSAEGAIRYYYNLGGVQKNEDGSVTITDADTKVYLIYTDKRPVDLTVLILSLIAAAAVLAAGAVVTVTLVRRKKR